MTAPVWQGFWRLADPKISLASMASIFLGTSAAARDGPLATGWLALTVVGIFAVEVAKNASGELFDYDSGTDLAVGPEDRSPFSGGKRVLVDRLLTRRQTAAIAGGGYAAGILIGLVIVLLRSAGVLWLGVAGIAFAFFYHAPPFQLSYRGLGELVVGLTYGPLICAGSYLVQRGQVTPAVILLSLPLGILIAAFLWINEFPDYHADLQAGKRTLVARMGCRGASRMFAGFIAAAFALLALLPAFGLPRAVWLGAIGLPSAIFAARRVAANYETTALLIPAQAQTLLAFVLLAIGSGLGLLAVPR